MSHKIGPGFRSRQWQIHDALRDAMQDIDSNVGWLNHRAEHVSLVKDEEQQARVEKRVLELYVQVRDLVTALGLTIPTKEGQEDG